MNSIKLDKLVINDNNLTNAALNVINMVDSVRYIDVSGNPIKSLNSAVLNRLTLLKLINLSNCDIESIDKYTFMGLESLQILDLSKNRLTSITPNALRPLTNLWELDLSGNDLQCSCDFKELKQLITDAKIDIIGDITCRLTEGVTVNVMRANIDYLCDYAVSSESRTSTTKPGKCSAAKLFLSISDIRQDGVELMWTSEGIPQSAHINIYIRENMGSEIIRRIEKKVNDHRITLNGLTAGTNYVACSSITACQMNSCIKFKTLSNELNGTESGGPYVPRVNFAIVIPIIVVFTVALICVICIVVYIVVVRQKQSQAQPHVISINQLHRGRLPSLPPPFATKFVSSAENDYENTNVDPLYDYIQEPVSGVEASELGITNPNFDEDDLSSFEECTTCFPSDDEDYICPTNQSDKQNEADQTNGEEFKPQHAEGTGQIATVTDIFEQCLDSSGPSDFSWFKWYLANSDVFAVGKDKSPEGDYSIYDVADNGNQSSNGDLEIVSARRENISNEVTNTDMDDESASIDSYHLESGCESTEEIARPDMGQNTDKRISDSLQNLYATPYHRGSDVDMDYFYLKQRELVLRVSTEDVSV